MSLENLGPLLFSLEINAESWIMFLFHAISFPEYFSYSLEDSLLEYFAACTVIHALIT